MPSTFAQTWLLTSGGPAPGTRCCVSMVYVLQDACGTMAATDPPTTPSSKGLRTTIWPESMLQATKPARPLAADDRLLHRVLTIWSMSAIVNCSGPHHPEIIHARRSHTCCSHKTVEAKLERWPEQRNQKSSDAARSLPPRSWWHSEMDWKRSQPGLSPQKLVSPAALSTFTTRPKTDCYTHYSRDYSRRPWTGPKMGLARIFLQTSPWLK